MSMAVASLRFLARRRRRHRLLAPLALPGGRAVFLSAAAEEVPQASAPPPPGRKVLESFREEFEIGGRLIAFETGKMARFANGSVVISMGDTHVLSTVAAAKSSEPVRDFLPLTVSKVSDVVSVGQVLSLTCIGQDARGNIKLSLKATLPPPKKKGLASKDTTPLPSQEVIGWAAVENMPSKDRDVEPSYSKDEVDMIEEAPAFSTPSVIIQSAADCDAQDFANGPKKRSKVAKSSPRRYKPVSGRQEVRTATAKKASGASTAKKNKKQKAEESGSNGLEAIPGEETSNILKYSSPTNFSSGSMKLGDVVTAKVYQIRAYGLVLELSDGVRGMHKFAENG